MAGSIQQILHPIITTRVLSQIAVAENPLLRMFGFEPGGIAELPVGHRRFGYDIFNNTRTVGKGAAPGEPAKTVTRQAVGRVNVEIARMHEKLPLSAEEINNYRPIGGSAAMFDNMGTTFIRNQQRFMGQRAGNFRAVLLGGMLQGNMYCHASGNDLYFDYETTTPYLWGVNWQRPSGNFNQLNILGNGPIISTPWDSPTTDIPSHLEQIDAALQSLVGVGLQRIVCGSQLWNYVTNNDYVATKAGIAQTPFIDYIRDPFGTINNPRNVKRAVLRAIPWLEWVITDAVISLGPQGSEVNTKLIPDGCFWGGPIGPNTSYWQMALGSEPISEGPNMPWMEKLGLSAWNTYNYDPTGIYLFALDNAIPCEYIPSASVFATAVGFTTAQ